MAKSFPYLINDMRDQNPFLVDQVYMSKTLLDVKCDGMYVCVFLVRSIDTKPKFVIKHSLD